MRITRKRKRNQPKILERIELGKWWCAIVLGVCGFVGQGLAAPSPDGTKPGLKIAYFMDVFVQDAPIGESRTQFEPWVRELVKLSATRPTEATLYNTYAEFEDKLTKSRGQMCDIYPMYAYDFVRMRQSCNLEALLVPEFGGEALTEYTIYVPNHSRISRLEDLHQKPITFEIGGRGELLYIWFENLVRRQTGINSDGFANIRSVPTSIRAALPVFFGEDGMEACVLSASGYKDVIAGNPQIGKFLRPLIKAPSLLTHVIACRRDLPDEQRQFVVSVSLAMSARAKSKHSELHFSLFKPELIESLEQEWLDHQAFERNEIRATSHTTSQIEPPKTFLEARAAAASRPEIKASAAAPTRAPFSYPQPEAPPMRLPGSK
jgi:hypothetical protein